MSSPAAPPQEAFSCRTNGGWIWTFGHVDPRRFKGRCLSDRGRFDGGYGARDLARAAVVHGWVLSTAGDLSGCGWDATMHFLTELPYISEGRWEVPDPDGEPVFVTVLDGPHEATWLDLVGDR